MNSKKLSSEDWTSLKLNIQHCAKKPKTRDTVIAKCHSCNKQFSVVFRELLRSVNRHVELELSGYHCKKCLKKSPEFVARSRKKSKAVVHKITKGASERSKSLWNESLYKVKMAKNHAQLSDNPDFAAKVSDSIKKKFQNSEYKSKVSSARKKYWDKLSYRSSKSWSLEDFVKAAKREHTDKYDYSCSIFINCKTKINIRCVKHGVFNQRPSHHIFYGNGCPQCAFEIKSSKPQLEISEWLESLGYSVILNDRKTMDGLEIDVCVSGFDFGIEYHGGYWHSYNSLETISQKHRHKRKADVAIDNNIKLFQIIDDEWINKKLILKSMILNSLGKSERIFARKCTVVKMLKSDARLFFVANHLHGNTHFDYCLGLEYCGVIVSAVSFANRGNYFEIIRFASLLGKRVIGGLSKILKNDLAPKSLMTYADRRYSNGNAYASIGLKLLSITKPGYYYWRNNKLFNRRTFQKHKLKSKLAFFNPELTESENMFNNGYRRIWDAGHYKFEGSLK